MKKRIVILGGGFGGVYTAMHLEKLLKKSPEFEIALVNRENYFVYQPMLAEVVGGSVGLIDTVSALRRLLPKTKLYVREIDHIDLDQKTITLLPQFSHTPLALSFDHLVFALGNVTDFKGMAGLHEHALPFKNLSDALKIRNHIIDLMETASLEQNHEERQKLLTVVVGGGGFSGTEVTAEINDLMHKLIKDYPTLSQEEIRVILVHSKERLMDRELSESLSLYAQKLLRKRGVEIILNAHLVTATPKEAILKDGTKIPCHTIISTVPSSPNPLIAHLKVPQAKGRIITEQTLQVQGSDCLWALGDCSAIPTDNPEMICPPTAQFAIREAKQLAENIVASLEGKPQQAFHFKGLGMMGALGHHSAVAELFGKIRLSGLLAWFMWRAIYWWKLPGLDRKIKVFFSWLLDMIIPIETVQLRIFQSSGLAELHFEPGETIFEQGDMGDFLYIIVQGKVEVIRQNDDGTMHKLGELGNGEFFGEMAILNDNRRYATVRCLEPCSLLAIRKSDFGALLANFKALREQVLQTEQIRKTAL